ncbi:MAG: excinuclease ABC subunit UvrA [Bacteroidota bacterium]|nr:excinuclease ABC subunit UvrA [Bacteroidota bacterium]
METKVQEGFLEQIEVFGARVHNLRNIDLVIPREKLVVITGLSGSGKSSLAFDTIYAEGQRRYMETFSAYARNFLGNMERPDVDKITGLSPVISIEQKTTNTNPRSTVGTTTEIYDFLRLLFARAGEAVSYVSGEKMIRLSDDQIIHLILEKFSDKKIILLAPVVKGRKGHYRELFETIQQMGFLKVRLDGTIVDIKKGLQADRYKTHDIEIVVDRIAVTEDQKIRITESVRTALKHGKGSLMVLDESKNELKHYSQHLMCPTSGISYDEPAPNTFSFNSPYGACPKCNGLGTIAEIDLKSVIPDKAITIKAGGIAPLGPYKDNWIFSQIQAIGRRYGFTLTTPIGEVPDEAVNVILYGSDEVFQVSREYKQGDSHQYSLAFEGIVNFISGQLDENASPAIKKWAQSFMQAVECPECKGNRLKKESLYFLIDGKNIAELAHMDVLQLQEWFTKIESRISSRQNKIAQEVLKEIRKRVQFLLNVGLDYLTMNRTSRSLSGGESQRIRLATQIGSQLVGVLYILDEPSIGLHQRDNVRLIKSLQELRDVGNSVIVVEHDRETIMSADYVVDLGPGAGVHGGHVVAQGTPDEILQSSSLTAKYLNGTISIKSAKLRPGNGKKLSLTGATGNNLKNVTANFPLGKFICVTGVSGSGKSTLINETLYPILAHHFYRAGTKPLPYKTIKGLQYIDKVIEIDQSPIGRTPRSNPATYTGVFSDIRNLFAQLPESKIRGYAPGWFSFNVKGGRCETCQGAGMRVIEMNFLPDVYVHCESCNGKRYNREILEVRYRGKSINDVLNMSIEEAVEFFTNMPSIAHKIRTIKDVGLGYITLGQQSTTLSGGEAQRVKLASELAKKDTGNTFYILDEPTTGLHFEDVRILLDVLGKLADKGNTVVVIEHNMDVIRCADHIIDIGPEGGQRGGEIIVEGKPEDITANKRSITGQYLKKELKQMAF